MSTGRVNDYMNGIRLALLLIGLGCGCPALAQTEIHKCTDADGGIVYSQLPCAPQEQEGDDEKQPEEAADGIAAEYVPESTVVLQANDGPPKSAEEVAECKKRYRDQIDAIDAEIQREYSEEKADDYKQRLLQLTRQLRQCSES